jgi:hypothetical protein
MAIRKQYRTMQGKIVDLEKLAAKNELVPAIGNIPVNARGDELGPGGRIIRKREDIVNEYYEKNTNFTPVDNRVRRSSEVPVPDHVNEAIPTPAPRNVDMPTTVITKTAQKEQPTE